MSFPEGAEPAERCATVNGLRIHYLEWGNRGNRPLVLLHGIARVAHTFDHADPAFQRQLPVPRKKSS